MTGPSVPIWTLAGARLGTQDAPVSQARTFPPLVADSQVDVAIVGAGITGLTLAVLLSAEGARVAVLERARVASGTTGRSTAHLTTALDIDHATLRTRFGDDGARLALSSVGRAIDEIERHARNLEHDCGFVRVPGFRYAHEPEATASLARDFEAARELGAEVRLVPGVPLPVECAMAIRFEGQAMLDPMAYARGLADAFAASGGALYEETPVVTAGRSGVVVAGGKRVRATHVVDATHTPMGVTPIVQSRLAARTSYVLAARIETPIPAALYWDCADPYHYVRTLGDDRSTVLIGGEDHPTGVSDPGRRHVALEEWARARFTVQSIEARWSHVLFEPADGLPYIGPLPGAPGRYVAAGFSGTGLTFGTVAALLLCDVIQGRSSPWAALYSPGRLKPFAAAPATARETVRVGWRFVADRLAGGCGPDLSDLPPDSGRVQRIRGEQNAVYRDARGDLHFLAARCTHLGCIVGWNDAEKTWDCPCHGGRFHSTGKVLYGPPVDDLARHAAPGSSGEED